jgi:ATP-dependent Clp protease adaptor protein ClpS
MVGTEQNNGAKRRRVGEIEVRQSLESRGNSGNGTGAAVQPQGRGPARFGAPPLPTGRRGRPIIRRMAKHTEHEHNHGVLVETSKPEVARPPLYSVLLLNDDYTPMDFVVEVLMRFFPMTAEKATQIMLHVHTRGRGVCGVFTREVAESKVAQVNEFSRLNQHPLLCTMERA